MKKCPTIMLLLRKNKEAISGTKNPWLPRAEQAVLSDECECLSSSL